MNVMDPVGWTAERLEWGMLWYICSDRDTRMIPKERVRAQFDGSLWYLMAADNEGRKMGSKGGGQQPKQQAAMKKAD